MTIPSHPYRSVLYMPGAKSRALEKARSLASDAFILDLEDAVAPAEKESARKLVVEAVQAGGFGPRKVIVRINGLDTEWGAADAIAAAEAGPDAILIPKVESAKDIRDVADIISVHHNADMIRIWAMMETPRGILNASQIAAAHPLLEGFVMGTNDLAKDLGAAQTPDRQGLLTSLSWCLLAARAEGLVCVDGVYNAFKDEEGLRAACIQGRDLGFDGKTLIHPAQLAVTNEVFAPSIAQLDLARREVAAYDAAQAQGEGVAVVDGKIVENLHAEMARHLIKKSEAIASIEKASGVAES